MFAKINNYKGVIIFYLLLALILILVSNHNKQIDMHIINNTNYIMHY